MSSRIGVALMAACLLLYIVLVGQRAIALFVSGQPVGVLMGVALVVLPLIGLWALVRELQFGFSADRLTRTLRAEGTLPDDDVHMLPSGRVVKAEASGLVQRYESEATAAPQDWRARLRLGIVQDLAGDRKAARASVRAAIRMERSAR